MNYQANEQVLVESRKLQYLLELERVVNGLGHRFNLLRIANSKEQSTLHFFEYGAVLSVQKQRILYPTHYAGLFSILSTSMWTIMDYLESHCMLPTSIDTTFTMSLFKDHAFENNYDLFFERCSQSSIDILEKLRPLKRGRFDNRGDYNDIFTNHIGVSWLRQFVHTYMVPTPYLQKRIDFFVDKYSVKSKKTLTVCYRGTDREIREDSDEVYIELINRIIEKDSIEQVIIQTEQIQIRKLFKELYGDMCVWIQELPGTEGNVAMHFEKRDESRKVDWTRDLIAMVYALSEARSIITYTGNIGLYLALFGRLHGKDVYQLR